MRVPAVVQDIKKHVENKYELMYQKSKTKEELSKTMNAFDIHIYQGLKVASKTDREKDLSLMKYAKSLTETLQNLDNQILDIDKIIILKLETYFGDFVAQLTLPERTNLAGDYINSDTLFFVPEKTREDYNEITPQDLFTLKALKTMLRPDEIKFINKEKYKE